AAYDDTQGLTAEFNRNLLRVLNRELDAGFDPQDFDHVALFDREHEWIEMRLRARRAHTTLVRALDLPVRFEAGEEMRTEISAKFTRERLQGDLSAAGLELVRWLTDADELVAQVQAAVAKAAEADGGLRVAVCCAGTGWAQKVAGSKGPHPLLPFETIVQINLIGTFNVMRFATAAMIGNSPREDGERGVCVNTASIAAFDGQVGQIAYSASKGGAAAMTLPAARDLAQYGVRVT